MSVSPLAMRGIKMGAGPSYENMEMFWPRGFHIEAPGKTLQEIAEKNGLYAIYWPCFGQFAKKDKACTTFYERRNNFNCGLGNACKLWRKFLETPGAYAPIYPKNKEPIEQERHKWRVDMQVNKILTKDLKPYTYVPHRANIRIAKERGTIIKVVHPDDPDIQVPSFTFTPDEPKDPVNWAKLASGLIKIELDYIVALTGYKKKNTFKIMQDKNWNTGHTILTIRNRRHEKLPENEGKYIRKGKDWPNDK